MRIKVEQDELIKVAVTEERIRIEKIIMNLMKRHPDDILRQNILKGILRKIRNVPKQETP
jgi:hypothetical protein